MCETGTTGAGDTFAAAGFWSILRNSINAVNDWAQFAAWAGAFYVESGYPGSQVQIEERLADLYADRGDVDEAIARWEARASTMNTMETSSMRASTLRNLGRLEARRGRHLRAMGQLFIWLKSWASWAFGSPV